MILELDLGNTRCKWRLRKGEEIINRGSLPTSGTPNELVSALDEYREQIKRILVASVVGVALEQSFNLWSLDYLSVTPEFARSTNSCLGVVNGYEEPWRLGVDRWVGMIACYQQLNKAFLLVSFGTAITVDIVLENGRHAGGFIAPGVSLMLDSLQQNTRQVAPDRNFELFNLHPGTSTTEAVYCAISAMLVGLVENGLKQLQSAAPNVGFDIVFAGGDASKILPFYPQALYKPELVLDGLTYIFDSSR